MKQAFRNGVGVYEDGQSSYSVNCQEARDRGRRPLTEAIQVVRELALLSGTRVTIKQAKTALIDFHDGEWHHTSKYGNRTSYYDPMAAISLLGIKLAL